MGLVSRHLVSHSLSHSVLLSAGLTPLHTTAAALAVAFEFAPQSFGDAQIGSAPEAIHFTGEVGGNLRRADHQQHLVVLMGSSIKSLTSGIRWR